MALFCGVDACAVAAFHEAWVACVVHGFVHAMPNDESVSGCSSHRIKCRASSIGTNMLFMHTQGLSVDKATTPANADCHERRPPLQTHAKARDVTCPQRSVIAAARSLHARVVETFHLHPSLPPWEPCTAVAHLHLQ